MERKEAVVAQPISLTWLCMDRVERTRQIPSVPYCTYRILDWYLCPLTRVSAQLWLKNGMWGCGGFMSWHQAYCTAVKGTFQPPDYKYIRHYAKFRGSVPLAIFVSLLDKAIGRFLSPLRVAGTEHMLSARYDMMVAQPRCREEAMTTPRGALEVGTQDVLLRFTLILVQLHQY